MHDAVSPGRRLFNELHRRRIFRTAALYIVGTWLALQVADVVFPALDIPERAIRYLLVAASLGFPIALVFGWFYDVGLHGIRRTAPAGADELAVAEPLRRSDYLILSALAGVVALILYGTIGNVVDAPELIRDAQGEGPPMIAVLPFASASLAGEGEFFANGVHDDLLTQLAKLQSIRVISRTSVMEYRDVARNMRKIGKELGADAILEGGVQLIENQIRINAQLIDARTDGHLWAQTYTRELSPTNIFAVQSEIARAITSALSAKLTPQDSQQLVQIPTENMAAYRAYHRAIEIRQESSGHTYSDPDYLRALEEAVQLDPSFSRAWADLVTNLAYLNFSGNKPEFTLRAEQALQHLQAIAPDSAEYRIGQAAYFYYALKDYDRAHDLISQALTLNPSDIEAINLKSWIERRQGDFESRIESLRLARTLDPRDPNWSNGVVFGLLVTHRYDEASEEIEEIEGSEEMTFWIGLARNLHLFREHRDFNILQESMEQLCSFFDRTNCGWAARVANRDYQGALDSLNEVDNESESARLSESDLERIFTHWLMGDDKVLAQRLPVWQRKLETDQDDSGGFYNVDSYAGAAMLAGIQGQGDKSERMIQRWFRLRPIDWADRASTRHTFCRVLGMIAATSAAVKCIRDGLEEPSLVMPFMEPYLPYYDSMRDEPLFVELLAELGGS